MAGFPRDGFPSRGQAILEQADASSPMPVWAAAAKAYPQLSEGSAELAVRQGGERTGFTA
ncbi:hypothetical protein ABT115_29685 [Streptomyces sp. NPDC001832]|uniref:hypothetical protein n=1 Tax=Streptomyces sp. NPDC001832 TaxID=3154527 RepID=UPI00331E1690